MKWKLGEKNKATVDSVAEDSDFRQAMLTEKLEWRGNLSNKRKTGKKEKEASAGRRRRTRPIMTTHEKGLSEPFRVRVEAMLH
ncbi:hypothetical protein RUM43_003578 [Polyplax serrata]|uniref:Uncharacterized protein n=1 Tax=Polyplax serrata TaxID=468196 RepID=A0AAN8NWZ5_POLSC